MNLIESTISRGLLDRCVPLCVTNDQNKTCLDCYPNQFVSFVQKWVTFWIAE